MSVYAGMNMGERILFVRENCGDLSQEEFAKRLGMTKSAISGYETGRRIPTDSVLKHIAREFRVDEGWLVEGNGEPFEPDDGDVLEEIFHHVALNLSGRFSGSTYSYQNMIELNLVPIWSGFSETQPMH